MFYSSTDGGQHAAGRQNSVYTHGIFPFTHSGRLWMTNIGPTERGPAGLQPGIANDLQRLPRKDPLQQHPSSPPEARSDPVAGCKSRLGPRPTRSCTRSAQKHGRAMDGMDELRGMFVPQRRLAVQLPTWPNGHVESFNGRFRDECLNTNWFLNLADARQKIEAWRKEYNEQRPHSS